MKTCHKRISAGDVIRWKMTTISRERRFLLVSEPNLFSTHFHADCREWNEATKMWDRHTQNSDFAFYQIMAIEKARCG